MKSRHLQSPETRAKIGLSKLDSGWRRRTKDKDKAGLQSSAWEEDFQTPRKQWKGRAMLWEEYLHAMDYDR